METIISPSQTAACEEHLARLLVRRAPGADGRLQVTPDVLNVFPGIPEEIVREFMAAKGFAGEHAQLQVLLPRYLNANADALDQPNALRDMRAWLGGNGCRPQTIQILRLLRQLGRRFSLSALPPATVSAIKALLEQYPRLLTQPVSYSGPGGLIAFARGHGVPGDSNTLSAAFAAFPITIARGRAVARNRLDQPAMTAAELTSEFCLCQPVGPVKISGHDGLIARLASFGVFVHGAEAVSLVEYLGRQPAPAERGARADIVGALNVAIGGTNWSKRARQITGSRGLFAQVLKLGVDCSADSVKRVYVQGGGRTKASVVRRAKDFSRKLPALLIRLRQAEPDFFRQPVPVRGRGGLKALVWKEGIRANHEVIRRYAEAVGIDLRRSGGATRAA